MISSSLSSPNISSCGFSASVRPSEYTTRMSPLSRWKRAGLIRGGIEHPQDIGVGDQLFDLSRGGAEQIGRIMSRADELPRAIRAQQKEKQRDELEGKRFFAEQPVHPVQDFLRSSPGAEFHAESAQHHRTQQGRGHPLAGDIRQNSHPFPRTQLQEIVEIPSHIARGIVESMDAENSRTGAGNGGAGFPESPAPRPIPARSSFAPPGSSDE